MVYRKAEAPRDKLARSVEKDEGAALFAGRCLFVFPRRTRGKRKASTPIRKEGPDGTICNLPERNENRPLPWKNHCAGKPYPGADPDNIALRGGVEKANPKLTAYQVELAQIEAEIEKLLDTLAGANATLLAYANKKIEELDTRRQKITKAIADLSVETVSQQQIDLLSGYLDDWENISFEDKRKATDDLISSISATSEYAKIEWKI